MPGSSERAAPPDGLHPAGGVAQLLDSLAVGGAEQLAIRIANGRSRRGHPSCIYVLRGDGPLRVNIDPSVTVRFLGVHRASIRNPLAFVRSLHAGRRRILDQMQSDGVGVLQSHLPNPNFWALLLAVTSNATAIPTIHNNREFSYGSSGLRGRLNRLAYRLMLRRCRAVVACSPEVGRSLLQALGLRRSGRLVAIANGVDIPGMDACIDRAALRRRFGFADDAPLVLAAGRLSDQKNFSLLIEAAVGVVRRHPGAGFVIAGEGERRAELEGHVERLGLRGSVVLPGNLLDLPDVMSGADMFVLSSRFEGLPLVLLEAMARALPVVGTDIPGIREVVHQGDVAILCPLDDPRAMNAAICSYLADPQRRAADGARGRALVAAQYSLDAVLDRLDPLYG